MKESFSNFRLLDNIASYERMNEDKSTNDKLEK